MMKVIIPTDFSDFANQAFRSAMTIAKHEDASLEIIHIIQSPIDWVKMDVINPSGAQVTFKDVEHQFPEIEKIISISKSKLNELKKLAESKGLNASVHLLFNRSISEAIEDNADRDSIVVMGSHGSSGFSEIALGSNAQKVVRDIKNPVYVLKNEVGDFHPQKVVYASSFDEEKMNEALDSVCKICDSYGADLHLLYVNTPGNFRDAGTIMNSIKGVAKKYGVEKSRIHLYNHYMVEYGITDFVHNEEFDLIAVPTHGYQGVMRMINFGIVEALVNHVDVPLVSFNIKK